MLLFSQATVKYGYAQPYLGNMVGSQITPDHLDMVDVWGVKFVTTTQPIDTTTPVGRLLLGVLAAFAEFEKALITERVNEGLDRARAEGVRLGRPPGSKDKAQRRRGGYFRKASTRIR